MIVRNLITTSCILFSLIATPEVNAFEYQSCMECHQGIEKMDENHALSCMECHLRPEDRSQSLNSHDKILRYPAAPEHMGASCGQCHQREISLLKNSLHYTLSGLIGQTRYLWGAQENPEPEYSASEHPQLKSIPKGPENPDTPAGLVDDLLQRRCLACHLGRQSAQEKGLYRGLGCSACHVLYDDDGIYKGGDISMKGLKGYPKRHGITKAIPVEQ